MAIRIRGIRQLISRFTRLGRAASLEVRREMDSVAEELLGRSQALVPELTRDLLLSGKIGKQDNRDRSIRVVGYGGQRAREYAVIRHEDFYNAGPITAAKASTQDGPPGRKYLERPFLAMRRRVIRRDFGKAINRATRRR
ncbi:MAG: hypothetical protein GY778_28850 [bacterium]|nr:hypothetical protein [bacterium]